MWALFVWSLRCICLCTEMGTMQITTAMTDALGRYLDLTSKQMSLTAGNMANVDTPGYKTQGFDFEQEMARQLNGSSESAAETPVVAVDGLVSRPDGNNVSMDREGLKMAEAQLKFRTGVALMRLENQRVMDAIHADR